MNIVIHTHNKMVLRNLITGGLNIHISRAPYVVRIYGETPFIGFCGGSLIGERTVLTAAHCISSLNQTIYVGTYQNDILANMSGNSDVVRVKSIYIHPQYDADNITRGHDVAVLTLQRTPKRFGLVDGPSYIPLANASFWYRLSSQQPLDTAYVLGYGSETYDGPQSLYLQIAHVHLYSHDECAESLNFNLAQSNFCAGLPDSDSCSGDSGGPLIVAYNGSFIQVGIVSWGIVSENYDCGDLPGIYSLTSSAYDVLAPFGAHYMDYTPTTYEDPCMCADDCMSNGFTVAPRCGCADHVGDGNMFCYVRHDDCMNASHSIVFMGALYRTCTLSSSSPAPSFPPTLLLSSPSSPSMSPPLPLSPPFSPNLLLSSPSLPPLYPPSSPRLLPSPLPFISTSSFVILIIVLIVLSINSIPVVCFISRVGTMKKNQVPGSTCRRAQVLYWNPVILRPPNVDRLDGGGGCGTDVDIRALPPNVERIDGGGGTDVKIRALPFIFRCFNILITAKYRRPSIIIGNAM